MKVVIKTLVPELRVETLATAKPTSLEKTW
jgi:hypothetical protein